VTGGGRGKRAESGGGRLVEERAHCPRLAQKSLHDGQLLGRSKSETFASSSGSEICSRGGGRERIVRKRLGEGQNSIHMRNKRQIRR
jgi:hypothetical protein